MSLDFIHTKTPGGDGCSESVWRFSIFRFFDFPGEHFVSGGVSAHCHD
jgi:hypothetical protein